MELEGIMLSKISHPRNKNTVCYHLYVELKKKMKQMNEYSKTETGVWIQRANQ